MSCRLLRWSVVMLTVVLFLGGSVVMSADPDDIFASDPKPAAKPEPKKKRNAMVTVLRVLDKQVRDMQAPAESSDDLFGPGAAEPAAVLAPSQPMPPPLPFNVRPRIIWPAGETAAERPAAAQDPFLEPEDQAVPAPRRPESNAGERKPEAPPRYRQSRPLGQSETPLARRARARIEEVLNRPTELELYETPLDEAVNLIKENHRIEVQIDKRALDDVGIATDTLVTKSLKGITLRSALNLMLRELDLTWIIIDEVLVITPPEVAANHRYLETYDASDLIGLGDEKGGPVAAGKRLAETIAATMPQPDEKRNTPKPGAITYSTFGTVSILTTTQNRDGHEHIAQWLADVRGKLAEKKPAAEPKKKRGKPTAEAVILKALKKKVSVDYVKEPLESVLRDLQEKFKINIQIDKKGLDDVGICPTTPITIRLKDIPLQSLLRLMLHDIDLTYMIKDDVLLITPPEVADQQLTMHVYDVADLVVCRNNEGELWDDYDFLTDTITSTIRPATWDAGGGPASIRGRTFGGGKVVIVSQTQEVHEEIVDFLAKLRAVTKKNANAPPPRRDLAPPPKPPADKSGGMGGGMGGTGMGGGMF